MISYPEGAFVPFSVTLHQVFGAEVPTKPTARQELRVSRKPKISHKTLKPGPYGARTSFMRLP